MAQLKENEMSLVANSNGTNKSRPAAEPLDAGTYPARISAVVDLGVQERPPWQGTAKPAVPMVWIQYSFVTEEYVDPTDGPSGEPRVLSESFPLFSRGAERSKAAMRLTRIDPANEIGNDFSKLLGRAVQVTVVHNPGRGRHEGRVFANVADVSAPMKGVVVEELKTPGVVFDTDDRNEEVYAALPQFVRDRIDARINKDIVENTIDDDQDWSV